MTSMTGRPPAPPGETNFHGIRYTFLAKMPLIMLFSFFVIFQLTIAGVIVYRWSSIELPNKPLSLLSTLAGAAFSLLVVVTTFNRLDPKLQSHGLAPRICALAGAFLSLLLIALPPTPLPDPLHAFGVCIILAGTLASVWVLRWLGRSFSIMAEARALVTTGPYGIVRHPLYITEGFALLGALLLHWSWLAVLLVVVQFGFQWRRILYEEAVLRQAFPDYDVYAQRVPRLIPRLGG